MFTNSSVACSFALRGENNFISFDELIYLYQNVVTFSYLGQTGFGFCKEITLSDDPSLTIYSVLYEKKFRFRSLSDFDYINLKILDDYS